jgi:hypothetical protein
MAIKAKFNDLTLNVEVIPELLNMTTVWQVLVKEFMVYLRKKFNNLTLEVKIM